MSTRIKLCDLDAFLNQQVLKVNHPLNADKTIIIIHKDGQFFSYENVCPHFSVQLDYHAGQFSTYQNQVIMCAHHSALFDIETGLCIDGPCKGQSLIKVENERINQDIYFK
ncbi:Rieske (2Fe-2S) protein [Acinetobacter johnsonii]|uniref:Rieske (2Fe-2S) protein n=1 Tax=Acinetobacter johnsonii TaxID=40214 RepID=UPI00216971D5|nr:Rieske 2Fe-2S domain-containing protein [Acinetobacter johnsonii]MCS3528238.1 nitrite reductase/ring-hydroxylating ferredoxin subunit [Acinetobacter johnsonii]